MRGCDWPQGFVSLSLSFSSSPFTFLSPTSHPPRCRQSRVPEVILQVQPLIKNKWDDEFQREIVWTDNTGLVILSSLFSPCFVSFLFFLPPFRQPQHTWMCLLPWTQTPLLAKLIHFWGECLSNQFSRTEIDIWFHNSTFPLLSQTASRFIRFNSLYKQRIFNVGTCEKYHVGN